MSVYTKESATGLHPVSQLLEQKPKHGGERECVVCDDPAEYHDIDVRGRIVFYCEEHAHK
ncbi:hypothetical protein GCM10009000_037370 [Halobacterium noricense]